MTTVKQVISGVGSSSTFVDGLGCRQAITLASGGNWTRVFGAIAGYVAPVRKGVNIYNSSLTGKAYGRIEPNGVDLSGVAGAVADADFVILPETDRQVAIDAGTNLWIWQNSGSAIALTARDLL